MERSLFIYFELELKVLDGSKYGDNQAHRLNKINFMSTLSTYDKVSLYLEVLVIMVVGVGCLSLYLLFLLNFYGLIVLKSFIEIQLQAMSWGTQ